MKDKDLIFDVTTPLGFNVHCTHGYWAFITSNKHPIMLGCESDVMLTLQQPDEVRRSRHDENVYLFYKGQKPRWLCAVARQKDKNGFLITAYPTDTIKIGETIWTKSK